MRILLLGANGFIGSAVMVRLLADGHELVAVARGALGARWDGDRVRHARLDLRHMKDAGSWLPWLEGVDAVVNCAGVLQSGLADSTFAVHDAAPTALWRACEQKGVRRIIQVSAMGAGPSGASAFSKTKGRGDAALALSSLDWVILRPSVVVGRAAYGGSALIRGLAASPLVPVLADSGPIDVVQLDDVVDTVAIMVAPSSPSRLVLELAGPDRLGLAEIVAAFRAWYGWAPARELRLPAWMMGLAWRAGDLAAWLGWRPPIRSTARRELVHGATGDSSEWRRVTGIVPRSLASALSDPAPVQEKWFARLFLLKPLAILGLALFWIATGIISLGPGWSHGLQLVQSSMAAPLAAPVVVAGALADLAIGLFMLWRRTVRLALVAGVILSVLYLAVATILVPALWTDPLGPLLKTWPIILLHLMVLAILDQR